MIDLLCGHKKNDKNQWQPDLDSQKEKRVIIGAQGTGNVGLSSR
jgi:hypothetical protein